VIFSTIYYLLLTVNLMSLLLNVIHFLQSDEKGLHRETMFRLRVPIKQNELYP